MTHQLCNAALTVLAEPLLAGQRLRVLLVAAVVLGVVVTVTLVRSARRPSKRQEPPMTRPKLLPHDDD